MGGVCVMQAVGPGSGLHRDQGLHTPQRGRGLLPHQMAPHQGLQLHQSFQRIQSFPCLQLTQIK